MANKKHSTIWILSELYYPEEAGAGYYLTRIAEAIANRHPVSVLTVQPTYACRGIKAPVNEVLNGVNIHRCFATALNKDIIPLRLINLITITLSIFINALLRIRQGDIVLATTSPPTLPIIAGLICTLRKAKLVLRVEDLYPQALLATRIIKPTSFIVKFCNVLQKWVYQRAECICVLGREMLRVVHSYNGNGRHHFELIPHWADSEEIEPMPKKENALLTSLNLTDKFVVQYSGNVGRLYDLESLAECAELLKEHSDIHFLLIGSGAKTTSFRKKVRELALKNVTVLPPLPRSQLKQSLNACDVAIVPFVSGIAGVSVPSRMYNIMSVGKPIVAAAETESEISRVISEESIGWVVQPESPDLLAQAILAASTKPNVVSEMAIRARSVAKKKYSRSTILRRHQELMDKYFN